MDEENTLNSIEVEKLVLGYSMIDSRFRDKCIVKNVTHEHFTTESHQNIWQITSDLAGRKTRISEIDVVEEMRKRLYSSLPWINRYSNKADVCVLQASGGETYVLSLSDLFEGHTGIFSDEWLDSLIDLYERRKRIDLSKQFIKELKNPNGLKTIDIVSSFEGKISGANVDEEEFDTFQEADKQSKRRMASIKRTGGLKTGIQSGITWLDKVTGHIEPTDLVVLAGDSSAGKSVLACHYINESSINNKVPSLVFPLEMNSRSMSDRFKAMRYSINFRRVKDNLTKSYENNFKAMENDEDFKTAPIKFFKKSDYNIDKIRTIARIHKRANPDLGLIVIDHIACLDSHDARIYNENNVLGYIAEKSKAMADELNIAVIIVAQHNTSKRKSIETDKDYRSPAYTDIDFAKNVVRPANFIVQIGLFPETRLRELCVTKARDGALGSNCFRFEDEYTRFSTNAVPYPMIGDER